MRGSGELSFVQFGEEVGEADGDGGVGDAEGAVLRLQEALGGGEPAAALPGVDGPDVLHAKTGVVVDAFLEIAEEVVLREDLDAEQRREADDGVAWVRAAENAEVRYAEVSGRGLDALLRENADLPILAMIAEDAGEDALDEGVGLLAAVALLEDAVEEVAVGPVGGGEVLGDGNERHAGHVGSIARCGSVRKSLLL